MKAILLTLAGLLTLSFSLSSCGVSGVAERKAVPAQGSGASDIPWNTPREGDGGGAFGGMLNQR